MDNLPMILGFTESKVDSYLFFKVEGGILVMLLLYVDDFFLAENRNSLKKALYNTYNYMRNLNIT